MADDYEFIVRGEAGPTVRALFADFRVDVGSGRSVLRGPVRDQAALHGVLDRIRDLGIELLEVRRLGTDRSGYRAG